MRKGTDGCTDATRPRELCVGERTLMWVDVSLAGLLGATMSPQECLAAAASDDGVDARVVSPGAARRWRATLRQRQSMQAFWVRADWSPVLRDGGGAFHRGEVIRVLSPAAAAELGAHGVVLTLLLGLEAAAEADNVRHLARYRAATLKVGLPMLVDLHLSPALAGEGAAAVVSLGLNLAVELGSDAVAVPGVAAEEWCADLPHIKSVPLLLRVDGAAPERTRRIQLCRRASDLGCDGLLVVRRRA